MELKNQRRMKPPPQRLVRHTGVMSDDNEWFYCVADGTVRRGKESRGLERMGPYPDEATARRALEIARERNKAADEQDKEWR